MTMNNITRLQAAAKKLNVCSDEINAVISNYEKAIQETNPGIPFFGSVYAYVENKDLPSHIKEIRRIGWDKVANNWCFVLASELIDYDDDDFLTSPHTDPAKIKHCIALLNTGRETRLRSLDALDRFISEYVEYVETKVLELTGVIPKEY